MILAVCLTIIVSTVIVLILLLTAPTKEDW